MKCRLSFLVVLLVALVWAPLAWCQSQGSGLFSTTLADQHGLTRNWFTQLPFNPFGDRIADVSMYVSRRNARCLHEVIRGDDRWVYTDQDLTSFQKPQGREKAKQKADEQFFAFQNNHVVLLINPRKGKNGSVMVVYDQAGEEKVRGVIHVVGTPDQLQTGRQALLQLVKQNKIEMIAIDHGDYSVEAGKLIEDVLATELAQQNVEFLQLRRHYEPEITMTVLTDQGSVVTVDAETGRVLWRKKIGDRSDPPAGVACTDDYTIAITGVRVYVMNRLDGKTLWVKKTTSHDFWKRPRDTIPSGSPAVSGDTVFLPALNGRLQAFYLHDEERPPEIYVSPGRVLVKPTVGLTSIAWPSDYGRVYLSDINRPHLQGRLQALTDIVAPVAYLPPDKFVAGSLGGFVYCFYESGGQIAWRLSIGEPIMQSPILVGESAFVIGADGGIFSIDLKTGAKNWNSRGVKKFIGASGRRIYCLDLLDRLVILDQVTGTRLAVLPTNGVDFAYLNPYTDRLYFGTKSGLMQCFRESQLPRPLVHAGVSTQIRRDCDCEKAPTDPTEQAANPGEPQPAQPGNPEPAGPNPFGGGAQPAKPAAPNPFGKENPFGGDGGNKKPMPNPFKGDNPFK